MTEGKTKMTFGKTNYKIMLAGLVLVVVGFMLMAGGKAESPEVFNEAVLSERRITLAPITVLLGYIVVGYGILKKSE